MGLFKALKKASVKRKKILSLILGISIIVSVFTFHERVVCKTVETALTKKYPNIKDYSFSYDGMYILDKKLILKNATLTEKKTKAKTLVIDESCLKIHWNGFPFDISVDLLLKKPVLSMTKEQITNTALSFKTDSKNKTITTFVEEGEIRLVEDGNNVSSIYASMEKGKPLVFSTQKETPDQSFVSITPDLSRKGSTFHFSHLNLSKISPFLDGIFAKFSSKWNVKSGFLDGDAYVSSVEISYDLTANQMEIQNPGIGVCAKLEEISWTNRNLLLGSYSLEETMFHALLGEGSLKNGVLCIEDVSSSGFFAEIELNGDVDMSQEMKLVGEFRRGNKKSNFALDGLASFKDKEKWKLDCNLDWDKKENSEMETRFSFSSEGMEKYIIDATFTNLDIDHIKLIQTFLPQALTKDVYINEALLSAHVRGICHGKKWESLVIDDLVLKDLDIELAAFEVKCIGDEVYGHFASTDPFTSNFEKSTWELDAHKFLIQSSKENQAFLPLEKLDFKLSMKNNKFCPSFAWGEINGFDWKVNFDGNISNLNISANIKTPTNHLLTLFDKEQSFDFPVLLQSDIEASIAKSNAGWSIVGKWDLISNSQKVDPTVFTLALSDFDVSDGISIPQVMDSFQKLEFESFPLSDTSINLFFQLAGKNWRVDGDVAFKGEVDRDGAKMVFNTPNVLLDTNFITLEFEAKEDGDQTISFDFMSEKWNGLIPLQNAKLTEKATGLIFKEMDSLVFLKGDDMQFSKLSTKCEDIFFKGIADLKFFDTGETQLHLVADEIDGNIQNAQKILQKFDSFSNSYFPLTGSIIGEEGSFILDGVFEQSNASTTWSSNIRINNGSYPLSDEVSIHQIACDFSFDSLKSECLIGEITGDVTVVSDAVSNGYTLKGHNLRYEVDEEFQFDIRLENQTHDLFRLCGKMESLEHGFAIRFDQSLSHFFSSKLEFNKIHLTRDFNVDICDLNLNLSLHDFINHCEFFANMGIYPIKGNLLEDLKYAEVDGSISIDIQREAYFKPFYVSMLSNKPSINKNIFEEFLLKAEITSDRISLMHCKLDDFTLFGTVERNYEGRINIPLLEATWNKSYIEILHGDFFEDILSFKIRHLNLCFDEIIPGLSLENNTQLSYLRGNVYSSGNVEVDITSGIKDFDIKSVIQLGSDDFGGGKVTLQCQTPLAINYSKKLGLNISDIDFNLDLNDMKNHWSKFKLDQFVLFEKEIEAKGTLSVSPEFLRFMGKADMVPFISHNDDEITFFDFPLKWENQIDMQYELNKSDESFTAKGELREGYYWIGNKSWNLENIGFEVCDNQMQVFAQTSFNEHPFELKSKAYFSDEISLVTSVCAKKEEVDLSSRDLTIHSSWRENDGFSIQSIEGELCGLDFAFNKNPKIERQDFVSLTGFLKVDGNDLAQVLPKPYRDIFTKIELGDGYTILGELSLHKANPKLSEFKGYLKGKNFELMGSNMGILFSELSVNSKKINLDRFSITDEAGHLNIPSISIRSRIDKAEDGQKNTLWDLTVPSLQIQDFRPSLISVIGKKRSQLKPFVISDLTFKDVSGTLGHKESFSGSGDLTFINTFKKDYHLIDIPIEIISRLGLDLGILVPVCGKLEYKIEDGKVVLEDLKDAYSEGKRSRFYLSSNHRSYVDLDGTLNVKIKMKQYVLLKLTEPFTLSMQGSLSKPYFALR